MPGQTGRRRLSRGAKIAIATVGTTALLGGAAAFAWGVYFSKIGGADSPEAAVNQFLNAVEAKDGVGIYGILAPDEVQQLKETIDAANQMQEDNGTGDISQKMLDSIQLDLKDVQLTSQTVDDGLAMVSITDGSLNVDVDADVLVGAIQDTMDLDIMPEEATFTADDAAELRQMIDENLPTDVDASQLYIDNADGDSIAPLVMTVEIDGAWYVSPLMTIGEYISQTTGSPRGDMPDPDSHAAFDSPEAAAEGMVNGLADYVASGDPTDLGNTLSTAEQRFMSVYIPVADGGYSGDEAVTVTTADFSSEELSDGVALVNLDKVVIGQSGSDATAEIADGCYSMTDTYGSETDGCLSDTEIVSKLGLDNPKLVAVQNGDGWSISITATVFHAVTVASQNSQDLIDSGLLDDSTELGDLLGAPADGFISDDRAVA